MDRSRQSIDLTRVSGTLAVQRNLMPSQVWVGGESDFLGEACSAVEERHCQAHWILHASGANNNNMSVLYSEQIASRFGRSFKLTSSTLIGSRGAMSCSGFLISDGTTWVLPPRYYVPTENKTVDLVNMRSLRFWLTRNFRRMLASRLSQNCLQRCSRLSLSKAEKSQITTGND